jgi:prepilin peptidase CpaA
MTQLAVFTLLTLSAWTDWRYRRVSNMLVFPSMLTGLLYQFGADRGWLALAGVGSAFALTLLPVLFRGMGMGDQKLLMAVGAWTSHTEVYALFLCSLGSCVLALLCSPKRWKLLLQNMNTFAVGWVGHRTVWLPDKGKSALSLPYAVHLLIADIVMDVLKV